MLLRYTAIGFYLVGLFCRYLFVLETHHPRHHVYSDSAQYLYFATQLLSSGFEQNILHTVWPPGTAFFMAFLYLFDPSLGVAAWVSFVLALMVPILVAMIAKVTMGARSAWWALIISSIHFGYVFYAGYFLSEWLSIFFIALGLGFYALAMTSQNNKLKILMGIFAGLIWGAAFSVRAAILPGIVFLVLFHFIYFVRMRKGAQTKVLVVTCIGFLMVLLPLAVRCTALSGGKACLVANNFAMNMALGYAGDTAVLSFTGSDRSLDTIWKPPSKLMHGYQKVESVPADIFDSRAVLEWTWERIRSHPNSAISIFFGNVFDLFNPYFAWPQSYGGLSTRQVVVLQQLFLFLILLPALLVFVKVWRDCTFGTCEDPFVWCLLSLTLGLMLVTALTLGEPRYRVPFDLIFILLLVSLARQESKSLNRPELGLLVLIGSGVSALTILGVVLISPGNSIRPLILERIPKTSGSPPVVFREFAAKPLSSWSELENSAQGIVFSCEPECEGVRFTVPLGYQLNRLALGTDNNDYYQLRFYAKNSFLGSIELSPHGLPQERGYNPRPLLVPEQVQRQRPDSVVVRPLFGDGNYHIGELWILPSGDSQQTTKESRPISDTQFSQ